jgi:hypothetical protein
MHVEIKNGIKIYTPKNFEDIFELTYQLAAVTKYVIVDCSLVRVLPSHFMSIAISQSKYITLINVSHSASTIFKTIGAENDIVVRNSIEAAIKHIEGLV